MTLDGDTDEIGALVRDAPQLTVRRVAPELHRQEVNALKDRVDDGKDGLLDNEETGDELSLFAQLTTLFKTVEILGQVMKNQYARIERSKKVAILDELFCAPLRALSGFYRHVKETPTYLVSEIEAALSRYDRVADDQRSRIARQIVSSIVQLVSFGFIYKAALALPLKNVLRSCD